MARRKKRITTKPGYVKYLRTSTEDAQAPERSQNGQRRDIERLLVAYPDLPDLGEYIDNFTGTSADRVRPQNNVVGIFGWRTRHALSLQNHCDP
jgi:hypothetical protein